jgi:hypothetical protein
MNLVDQDLHCYIYSQDSLQLRIHAYLQYIYIKVSLAIGPGYEIHY